MKSKELIRLLQECDPTGETEVVTTDGDIYFVAWEESGAITELLIRDPKTKDEYNIIGSRITRRVDSICLVSISAEEALLNDPEATMDLSELNESDTRHWKKLLDEARERSIVLQAKTEEWFKGLDTYDK